MSARFHAIRDRATFAVDRVFAEAVRLSPMADGRSDPARPQHVFEAVLRTGEGKQSTASGTTSSASQEWRSRFAGGSTELHIDRTTYNGPVILQGDKVRATSRPSEPLFEVLFVDERSHSRLVVHLGEAK